MVGRAGFEPNIHRFTVDRLDISRPFYFGVEFAYGSQGTAAQ
jgi:hypothetical protein